MRSDSDFAIHVNNIGEGVKCQVPCANLCSLAYFLKGKHLMSAHDNCSISENIASAISNKASAYLPGTLDPRQIRRISPISGFLTSYRSKTRWCTY